MRRILTLPAFSALLLVAASALAANPIDKKAAEALFRDGRAAFDKSDFATACAKFEASLKLDPALGTQLNLAVCEEKIGRLKSARRRLADLVAQLPPKDDRAPFAKDLTAKLDARIPTVALSRAPDAPADTTAHEGSAAGPALPLGELVALDPGDHELVVTASGRAEARIRLHLDEGQREQRAIAPGAPLVAATEDPLPESSADKSRKLRRTIGYVAGGVGVAGIGLAAVSGVLLLSKKSDLDAHCPSQRCDAEGLRLLDEAESTPLLPLNTVGWIVGIAGVGAGAVLILTSRAPSAPQQSARFTPYASPTGGGFAVDGRF